MMIQYRPLLLVVYGIVILYYTGLLILMTTNNLPDNLIFINVDFYTYYAGSILFSQNQSMYDGQMTASLLRNYELIYIDGYNYIYHPLIAIILSGITTIVSPQQAGLLWYITNLVAFIIAIYIFIQVLHSNPTSRLYRDYLVLSLLFIPTAYSFFVGQINPLLMLFMGLSFHAMKSEKMRLSGVLWGIAIMLKIMPALFILYFIATKKFTSILYGLATVIMLNFITIILFYQDLLSFVDILLSSSNQLNPHPANQSLGAFIARLLTTNIYSHPMANIEIIAKALYYVIVLILGLITFWIIYQHANKTKISSLLGFNLIFIVMVLISPLSWENFYILLVLPLITFIRYWKQLSLIIQSAIVVAIGLIMMQRIWAIYGNNPESFLWLKSYTLLMSCGFYGAVILYIVNIVLLMTADDIHDKIH